MVQQTFDPHKPYQDAPIILPFSQKEPAAKFLRPLPTSLIILGTALTCGFLLDQATAFPPRFYDVPWRIAFLEKFFNAASIPLLGVAITLGGIWMGDFLAGAKNKVLNLGFGSFGFALGLILVLSVPLYSMDARIIQRYNLAEIESQRIEVHPEKGSEDAAKFDAAVEDLNLRTFRTVFRMNAYALLSGGALILLGSFGVRQVREKADVGFCCPNCMSEEIHPSSMDPSERSLAFTTRLHMFLCHECGWRFRRFSLTGKPFTFFF